MRDNLNITKREKTFDPYAECLSTRHKVIYVWVADRPSAGTIHVSLIITSSLDIKFPKAGIMSTIYSNKFYDAYIKSNYFKHCFFWFYYIQK